jgi:hypothetical protein
MGHMAPFTEDSVKIRSHQGTVFAKGRKVGRIYIIRTHIHPAIQDNYVAVARPKYWDKWHRILGHINVGAIKLMKSHDMVTRMKVDSNLAITQCIACIESKQTVELFPK